jgi:hypothetical protein
VGEADKQDQDTMPDWQRRLAAMAAVVLLVGWAIVNGFLLFLAGQASDASWARLIVVLNGVEAVAFAAAGFLFGTQVNRAKAEEATARANQATDVANEASVRARDAQAKLDAAQSQAGEARVEAAKSLADAEQADLAIELIHRANTSPIPTVMPVDPDREAGSGQGLGDTDSNAGPSGDPGQHMTQVRNTIDNIYDAYRARHPR